MSSMVFDEPGPHRLGNLERLSRFVRWCGGAAAVALAIAGCGGGGGGDGGGAGVSAPAPAAAQMNPVAAFALAQQSVVVPAAAAAATPSASGNMVANAGFESGTTDWINWGNASAVSGQASSGTSALRVGSGAGGAGQEVGGIVPGTTYRLAAQARVTAPSEIVYIGVNFIDASGAPFTQNSVLVSSTAYTTASLDVVAPPNAARALVYVWKNEGSGLAYVDDFNLAPVGVAPSKAAASGNLVADAGFESGLVKWENWGNATTSIEQAAVGSNVAQVGTGAGGVGQHVGGIVAGNTYRVSALAKVSRADETGYLGVMFEDDAGTGLLAQNVVFRSTSYSNVQADVTAPANATRALVFVWKNAGSGFVYVDEVSLVQVAPGSPSAGSPTVLANANTTVRGVAVLANGVRVAAWSDDTGVHSQLFDAQGGLVGGPVLIAPSGRFSGVAALTGGSYVVEYDQPGLVLVQMVSAAGALAGPPVIVRTQAQTVASNPQLNTPRLAGGTGVYALGNGGFAAVFLETHSFSGHFDHPGAVLAQLFDAQGNPVEAAKFVAQTNATQASDPGINAVSRRSGGIIVGTIDLSPTPSGGTALIPVYDDALNLVGVLQAPPNETGVSPWGAELTDGTEVAIWSTGSGGSAAVHGRLFVPGQGLQPVQTFANAGPGARLTALAGGGFVLTWGTFAQAFNARGQAVGGVMQILDGSIAATPDGGFVIVAQVGAQLVEQQYAVAVTP